MTRAQNIRLFFNTNVFVLKKYMHASLHGRIETFSCKA